MKNNTEKEHSGNRGTSQNNNKNKTLQIIGMDGRK